MKRLVLGIISLLLCGPISAIALTITFNNTAPTNGYTQHGTGVYVESGYTFTASATTNQFSISPGYNVNNAPPDNSDYETFEQGPPSWTLTGGEAFSLASFQAATIYVGSANTLTLTGHLNGGGTIVQVFNLPAFTSTANWNTYVLPAGWVNLTSVDFINTNVYVGIDNVVVSSAEPSEIINPSDDASLYTCSGCNPVSNGGELTVSGYIQGAVKFPSSPISSIVTNAQLSVNPYSLPLWGLNVDVYGFTSDSGLIDAASANAGTYLGTWTLPANLGYGQDAYFDVTAFVAANASAPFLGFNLRTPAGGTDGFSSIEYNLGHPSQLLVTLSSESGATMPSAPTNVVASGGIAQATVSFNTPASNGSAQIDGYTVTSSPAGGVDSNAGSTSLVHVVTGLTNGTTYIFTVTAHNSAGTGAPSDASNSVTPAAPSVIINPSDDASLYTCSGCNLVSNGGGLTVSGYIQGAVKFPSSPISGTVTHANLTINPYSLPLWSLNVDVYGFTSDSGLIDAASANAGTYLGTWTLPANLGYGQDAYFDVTAFVAANASAPFLGFNLRTPAGGTDGFSSIESNYGHPSQLLVTLISLPSSPENVAATSGNAQATVTFSAPASNGGAAIDSYTATSNPGGLTGTCAASPCAVTGLTNGTPYTFTVTAHNSVGNSAPSAASNSVTPIAPATISGAPTIGAATAGNSSATVAFTAPANNGGAAIDYYTATSNPGSLAGTCSISLCTVSGLTNGQSYTFTVTAHNSVGDSAPSNASNSVTPLAPGVDLIPTSIGSVATTVVTGATLAVTDTVQNQGTVNMTAKSITVKYYLSSDATITSTDTLLGSRTIAKAALTSGASSTATTTFTVPATLAATAIGTPYYIGEIVDTANAQVESNKANNTLASSNHITVRKAGVDLVPTAISAGANSIITGTGLTVTDTVQNQGPSNMTATSITVKYYLSTDAAITSTDTLLGSRTIAKAAMTSGASNTASNTFTVPTMASGNYYLGEIVDSGNAQTEISKTNNTLASSGTINIIKVGVDLIPTALAMQFTQVAAGAAHTVAILSDGSLWSWGDNTYGQLGDGTTKDSLNPKQIGSAHTWIAVAAGAYHTVALQSNGSLWAWGWNAFGQLGDGSTNNQLSPEQIGAAYGTGIYDEITAGAYHTVAVQNNGSLWAWGNNSWGQLGDGTGVDKTSPILIDSGYSTNPESLAAGYGFTLGIKSDGSLWAWGDNTFGQLGDSSLTLEFSPELIGSNTWVAVAAGGDHSAAIALGDGSLWTWGLNANGQLGDGTRIKQLSSELIDSAHAYVDVAAGGDHTAAIRSDDTLWVWGMGQYGQIGNGSKADSLSPVQVGINIYSVTAGGDHTASIRNDGSVWAWGLNGSGQIGDSTMVNRMTPVQSIPTLAAGKSFVIFDTVKNQGTTGVTAATITVRYYLSTDTTITSTDTLVGSRTIAAAALASEASSTASTVLTIPSTLAAGTYYIGEIVDATNVQTETNKTNNTLAGGKVLVHH